MTQTRTGDISDVSYEWRPVAGGKTITETIVEDGVEMLSTDSGQNRERVVKHYCARGTGPVLKVREVSDASMSLALDQESKGPDKAHNSFVTDMKWMYR